MKIKKALKISSGRSGKLMASIASVAMVLMVSSAGAAINSAERLKAFANMQDWSGLWEIDGSPATLQPQPMTPQDQQAIEAERQAGSPLLPPSAMVMRDYPPYNDEWEAKYQAMLDQDAELRAGQNTNFKYCAAGMPRVLASPFLFEVIVTPEKTWFYHAQREMRHVYTDGRDHPPADELWPTLWGDSVGHWQGDTLVIDTISIIPELFLDPTGAKLSGEARIQERWSMIDQNHLQNEITITDPVAFKSGAEWNITRQYKRVTDYDRIIDDECGENKRMFINAEGKLETIPNN